MASKKVESCLSMMAQYYNMYIEDESWREKEDIDWLKTGNHVHIRNFLDRGASRRGKDLDEDLSEIKRFFETHPVPVR
ncbi:MAG: hypothetical protein DIU66_007535 [Bacillota bacterium]|nr:MAG: hypothetical protein DIU66_06395 [Bacillota bacterium]